MRGRVPDFGQVPQHHPGIMVPGLVPVLTVPARQRLDRDQHLALAAITSAPRRYLLGHDALAEEVIVIVPVDLHPAGASLPSGLGNAFGLVFVRLPTGESDQRGPCRTPGSMRSPAGPPPLSVGLASDARLLPDHDRLPCLPGGRTMTAQAAGATFTSKVSVSASAS